MNGVPCRVGEGGSWGSYYCDTCNKYFTMRHLPPCAWPNRPQDKENPENPNVDVPKLEKYPPTLAELEAYLDSLTVSQRAQLGNKRILEMMADAMRRDALNLPLDLDDLE